MHISIVTAWRLLLSLCPTREDAIKAFAALQEGIAVGWRGGDSVVELVPVRDGCILETDPQDLADDMAEDADRMFADEQVPG